MKNGQPIPQPATDKAYFTSKRGRSAIAHLWIATRAIDGASLTDDDRGLVTEALMQIGASIGGVCHE